MLDLKIIVMCVRMISSNCFSNMIVRLIMVLSKVFNKRAQVCLMLKLLVGNVLSSVGKKGNMILLV